MFIVAYDVVGGMFAINHGRFEEEKGKIWYFSPDSLEWEPLSMKFSEFVAWLTTDGVAEFYSTMRWQSWTQDVKTLTLKQGVLIYPFLWAQELDIETATKKNVPWEELFYVNLDYVKKFGL